jgi:hypothetical protein
MITGEVFTAIEEFGSSASLSMGVFEALGEQQSNTSGSGQHLTPHFGELGDNHSRCSDARWRCPPIEERARHQVGFVVNSRRWLVLRFLACGLHN